MLADCISRIKYSFCLLSKDLQRQWSFYGTSYKTDRDGNQNVFALNRNGGELKLNSNWTDNEWNPDNLAVARLGKRQFSASAWARFLLSCDSKFLLHPPSILPASSKTIASSSHCVWEISFASQQVVMRYFSVSKSTMHSAILDSFILFSLKYVIYVSSRRSKNFCSIRAPKVYREVFGI